MRALLIVCLLLSNCVRLAAQDKSQGEVIVDQLIKSTVMIVSPLAEPKSSIKEGKPYLALGRYGIGTGVYIGTSDQGNPVILTNYHVVQGGYSVRVIFASESPRLVGASYSPERISEAFQNGREIKLLAKSTSRDLALLEIVFTRRDIDKKIKGGEPLPLAGVSVRAGAEVHTIGCTPAAGLFSYTQGSVRSVGQREFQIYDDRDKRMNKMEMVAIETTNPLNRGDSGGPLVNAQMELVGIAQSKSINASLVSVFVDRHELAPYLEINKIKLAPPRKVVANNKPNEKAGGRPADKGGARTDEIKRPVDDKAAINHVMKPMAPLPIGPKTCITFNKGFIAQLADQTWTYQEFRAGVLKSGKLVLRSHKEDETVFFDEQNKVYYRITPKGLERSANEKDWEAVDEKAGWNQ